ncbi:DUF1707 domain-containing protein [Pseudonocardia sp. NPDC049635]|uniref:DUF1707 SHOCT-like domain-containing protein n=1 Tax=Pseudonocardia sp. NPDC049635 TaxID=3155506 RepID=UPI0033C68453
MGDEQGDDGKAVIRVSDAERQETAERLKLAHDEGRLSLVEYDERLRAAYAARVRADLVALEADLPRVKRKDLPAVRAEQAAAERSEQIREYAKEWRSWAGVAVLLTAIWAITSIASGQLNFFWPMFPIGIWGAVLVAQLFWDDDD